MERPEVVGIVCRVVKEAPDGPEAVDENTILFGSEGFLDSFSLVNAILDIEQQINDRYNLTLSLDDERSLSQDQEHSPFRTVASFADYILKLAAEQAQARP